MSQETSLQGSEITQFPSPCLNYCDIPLPSVCFLAALDFLSTCSLRSADFRFSSLGCMKHEKRCLLQYIYRLQAQSLWSTITSVFESSFPIIMAFRLVISCKGTYISESLKLGLRIMSGGEAAMPGLLFGENS